MAGGYLVACWNAFVLHSLGAGLLDADYAADPGTVGYVPAVTFEQAWSWFAAAEGWLSQARQLRENPDYNLGASIRLPAGLPDWVDADPCPPSHLRAVLAAVPPIREHAELALFDLARQADNERQRTAVNALRQQVAEAGAAADYALALAATQTTQRLHDVIETHIRRAATLWFRIGQLAAMPTLIGGNLPKAAPTLIDPETLPGGSRFDPWCLTDPHTRSTWQADPQARKAIDALWAADPDPVHTLSIHAQIQAALASGAIVQVTSSRVGRYFYSCPWYPMYRVRRRLRIDGERLSVPQQFTFDVSAEKVADGGAFVRQVLRGPFTATDEVDYSS